MKSIIKTILLLFILCIIVSCSKQNDSEISEELQIHFDSFASEALTYGIEIDFKDVDIDGYIENIEERGTLGQCKSYSDGSKKVIIDQPFWNQAAYDQREYIVFHELGHCVLDREHNDQEDENGNCLSIMQSGNNACMSGYSSENRTQLLSELFNN